MRVAGIQYPRFWDQCEYFVQIQVGTWTLRVSEVWDADPPSQVVQKEPLGQRLCGESCWAAHPTGWSLREDAPGETDLEIRGLGWGLCRTAVIIPTYLQRPPPSSEDWSSKCLQVGPEAERAV